MPDKKRQPKIPVGAQAIARALANPGRRSKLPASMLTPEQRRQRALNARLNAPVTAGSSLTNRDAARAANAAATVRYAPAEQQLGQQLTQAQGAARDVPAYYDAYQKQIGQHAANVATANQQANDAISRLLGGVKGLEQPAGDQTAQNAAQVRQQMLAALGGQIAGQGAAAARDVSNFAGAVVPGQKLQAQSAAQKAIQNVQTKQTDLAGQKGAFVTQTRGQLAADEQKNILATTIATGKSALDQAQLAETTRANKADEANAAAARRARQAEQAGAVNSHGYTTAQWNAMTVEQRRDIIAQDKKSSASTKGKKPARGPGSLTAAQESAIVRQINEVAGLIKSDPKDKDGNSLTRDDLITGDSPLGKPLDPRLVNIALDLARNGGLSPANVKAVQGLNVHVGGNFPIAKKKPKVTIPPGGTGTAVGTIVGSP